MIDQTQKNIAVTGDSENEPILLVDPNSLQRVTPPEKLAKRIAYQIRIDGIVFLQLTPSVWAELYCTMEAANQAANEKRIDGRDLMPMVRRFLQLSDWALRCYGQSLLNDAVTEEQKRRK